MTAANDIPKPSRRDRVANGLFRAIIGLALVLPYRWRIPFAGWVTARIVAPLAGYSQRVRDNLALVRPDLPPAEVTRLTVAVPNNVGRTLVEIYSGTAFKSRIAAADPLTGPGVAALEAARSTSRPVILAVAHFGNYDAMRAALVARGFEVGAVYRPMDNPIFNAHYIRAISRIAKPLFPRTRKGIADMLRFLKSGGILALGVDQHYHTGAKLTFFGHPAKTTLTPAEFALKYDCDLIPIHAIRRENGLDFDVRVDLPIPHSNSEEMMQAVNDNLEEVVRQHMDQWFWIHRRWKG